MNEIIFAIGGLGTPELLVIAVVIFLLFGATRLPQLAKSLGQSKRAFKEGLTKPRRKPKRKSKRKTRNPALAEARSVTSVGQRLLANHQRRLKRKRKLSLMSLFVY